MKFPVWDASIKLTVALYKITNDGFFDSEPVLRGQIRSNCINLLANISNAMKERSYDSKIYFLKRSKVSSVNVENLVIVAEALGALDSKLAKEFKKEVEDIGVQIDKLSITFYKKKKVK